MLLFIPILHTEGLEWLEFLPAMLVHNINSFRHLRFVKRLGSVDSLSSDLTFAFILNIFVFK